MPNDNSQFLQKYSFIHDRPVVCRITIVAFNSIELVMESSNRWNLSIMYMSRDIYLWQVICNLRWKICGNWLSVYTAARRNDKKTGLVSRKCLHVNAEHTDNPLMKYYCISLKVISNKRSVAGTVEKYIYIFYRKINQIESIKSVFYRRCIQALVHHM